MSISLGILIGAIILQLVVMYTTDSFWAWLAGATGLAIAMVAQVLQNHTVLSLLVMLALLWVIKETHYNWGLRRIYKEADAMRQQLSALSESELKELAMRQWQEHFLRPSFDTPTASDMFGANPDDVTERRQA